MSSNKFLTVLANGTTKLLTAINSSLGAGDANKILMTNSQGKVDVTFMPEGLEIQVESAIATEDLIAGNFVNFYDNGGVPSVRKAIANDIDKIANGFVLNNFLTGATALIYTKGVNTSLGSTEGSKYYLSATTAGLGTITAPSQVTGNFLQVLGFGVPRGVLFEFDDIILFA